RSESCSSCTARSASSTSMTRTATASSWPKSFPRAELAAASGSAPVRWQLLAAPGGYAENTAKWRVELEDGRRVFVKHALDELAAGWLRAEHLVYAAVSARFLPE